MTEERILAFKNKFSEFLELTKNETNKIRNADNIGIWFRNLYGRYRYAKLDENSKYGLPREHMKILIEELKKQNITEEEFDKTSGNRKKLSELLKEKSKKEYSIEELKSQKTEIVDKISDLTKKQTSKYIQLYRLTPEQIKKIQIELEECQTKRKKINELIEELEKTNKKPEEPKQEEITTPNENYNSKMQGLIKRVSDQEETIKELSEENNNYRQNALKIKQQYQDQYEKKLEESEAQLKNNYEKKLETETNALNSKYNWQIQNMKKEFEEQQRQIDLEQRKQAQISTITREKQKESLVKLLCSNGDLTMEDIKTKLEQERITSNGMKEALAELKTEIPGIVRGITKDGKQLTYEINGSAMGQLNEYKQFVVSPSISNVIDGEVQFLVRADMHLNMTNGEDTIKKILYPYMSYCAQNGNMPIIDLGDIAETIKGITIESWNKKDREAIKLAYKFYKNYAKTIAQAPEIENYGLIGNHDEHPFRAGVDPIQILFEYAPNFTCLGVSSGSFRIANNEIAVFHDKNWQNIISYKDCPKAERDEFIYEYLCEEMKNIAKDYVYSLMGHYHFGKINTTDNFSVINNGIDSTLLFTAVIKDSQIEKMYVTELNNTGTKIIKSNYDTEIFNRTKTL